MKRITAVLLAFSLLFALSACRVRVDLSEDPLAEGGTPTTSRPTAPPEGADEMAKHAWQVYKTALEKEETYESFELHYEGRQNMLGKVAITRARMVQVTHPDGKRELLVNVQLAGGEQSGYYKDGVAYFHIDGKKYWMPTDEETFLSELGFSESANLLEPLFSEAIVANNPDGTVTVSCPLVGEYASQYAAARLGESAAGGQVTRAEETVTVDANGAPTLFTATVGVNLPFYGEVWAESTNRYVATGADVVLTPPADLEDYVSIID